MSLSDRILVVPRDAEVSPAYSGWYYMRATDEERKQLVMRDTLRNQSMTIYIKDVRHNKFTNIDWYFARSALRHLVENTTWVLITFPSPLNAGECGFIVDETDIFETVWADGLQKVIAHKPWNPNA